jgi:hypothetical protein
VWTGRITESNPEPIARDLGNDKAWFFRQLDGYAGKTRLGMNFNTVDMVWQRGVRG